MTPHSCPHPCAIARELRRGAEALQDRNGQTCPRDRRITTAMCHSRGLAGARAGYVPENSRVSRLFSPLYPKWERRERRLQPGTTVPMFQPSMPAHWTDPAPRSTHEEPRELSILRDISQTLAEKPDLKA